MTREEAISTIKTAQADYEWTYPYQDATAFDIAIKAIEDKGVLDKIRTEIEQLKTYDRYTGESYLACEFKEDVLHIIDKYRVESEEEKWWQI